MKTRIRELRLLNNETQQEFADKLNVSRNFICLLESGERAPSDRTIDNICRVYGVNKEWLITGEGEVYRPANISEELYNFIDEIINDPCVEDWQKARRAFVLTLIKMSPDFWVHLNVFFEKFIDEMNRGENND